MPPIRANLVFMVTLTLIALPALATRTHRVAVGAHGHSRISRKAIPKPKRLHGQQVIQPSRITEIQQALIREHYLSGEADGSWSSSTEAAMRKYQADQGWQTKLMPDSRALKKLGLGPDYSTAINAKDSTFASPPPVGTISAEQAAGFSQASGVNQ